MTVERAIWRDQLTAAERAAPGRGSGAFPDPRPAILVVGGGIMGVATAAACCEAGLGSVLLIETGRLATGATGGATGLLSPEPHQWSDPEPLVDLERASLERWRELEQRLPGGVGLVEIDWIGLAPHPGGFAAHQPPAVEWLAPGQVEQLIPSLARSMEGALIRRQARGNPLPAVARLAGGRPGLGIAYQWCCFRPRHPDRRPVIDRVPGLDNAWLTAGHFRTGILNAPATASVLARWISTDQPPAEPGTWSATRFSSGIATQSL